MTDDSRGYDRLTGTAIDLIAKLVVLGLLAAWCFVLLRPFIATLLWSAILAIALFPVFLRLKGWLFGSGTLAASLIALAGVALILGPVGLMATGFAANLQDFIASLADGSVRLPPPPPGVADWPVVGKTVSETWQLASENLQEALGKYATQVTAVATFLLGMVADLGLAALQFILAFVVAAVIMVNAEPLGHGSNLIAVRLTPSRGTAFVELARNTVRNVARGVIGVSLLQSLLIGIGMVSAGIPGAGIWTLICLVLAIVQIGPGIVVIATLVYAWAALDTLTAVLYTVWMVPAMLIDNVLRPLIMARGLPVPMLVIFIGVLGGTLVHGLIGLFIGPVILAFGYELVRAWTLFPAGEATTTGGESPPGPPRAS